MCTPNLRLVFRLHSSCSTADDDEARAHLAALLASRAKGGGRSVAVESNGERQGPSAEMDDGLTV